MKRYTSIIYVSLIIICFTIIQQCTLDRPFEDGAYKVEEIIIVCKTHFDIGYTHRVEDLLDYYRTTMIDRAIDNMDKSDSLPPEQKFVWTGPGWVMDKATEEWDGQSDVRRDRLEEAFLNSRFITHALPFTFHTDVCSPELLARSFQPSSKVARKFGLPLPGAAKMTDVPSHSSIMATVLANAGVEFLHIGCNWPSGSVKYPALFWWEGPDGSKTLTMYSSIYGTCTALWPKSWGSNEGKEHPGTIGINLLPPENWPYKTWLAIIVTPDNTGPPDAESLEPLFREVRETYPDIKLRMGRMEDFSSAIIESDPDLPVIKAEAPDTWIHGVMCDPGGQKQARELQYLVPAVEALNTHLGIWGLSVDKCSDEISWIFEQCMLYDEHTWGGFSSVHEYGQAFLNLPDNKYSNLEGSWEDKTNYIREAGDATHRILNNNLTQLASSVKLDGPRILVYNPLPWSRSGRIEIPGEQGNFLMVKDIPPCGYKTISADINSSLRTSEAQGNNIENDFYKITVDPSRGIISSLVDKRTGREWVDSTNSIGLGQYLNERFTLEQTLEYTLKYQQKRAMGSFDNPDDQDWPHPGIYKPGMISEEKVPYRAISPSSGKVIINTDATGQTAIISMPAASEKNMPGTELKIQLDDGKDYIDMEITIKNKVKDNWPEADWLCLPFDITNPVFRVGRNLGIMNPEDIVPGSNRHLYTTGTGVIIQDENGDGISIYPIDHPLVSLGEPGCWKFSLDYVPEKPVIYLNLYNNQWNTNFRYWYPGTWSSRVRIRTLNEESDISRSLAMHSLESRVPLQVVKADGPGGNLPIEQEGVSLSRPGVAVTAFGDDFDGNEGILLRVWEMGGTSDDVTASLPQGINGKRAQPVNLRGELQGKPIRIRNNKFSFNLDAYAPASFIIR